MRQMTIHAKPAQEQDVNVMRSMSYLTFARAFGYPDREDLEAIRAGQLGEALYKLIGAIDPILFKETNWVVLRDIDLDDESFLVEFTRLFEAGENGAKCPLNSAHYGGGKRESLEELVRYYEFFGLSLETNRQVEPDELVTQLEFMHFLSFQEFELVSTGEDAVGLRRAQRDFIQRHLGTWIPMLCRDLGKHDAPQFFQELTTLLERFLHNEQARLTLEIESKPTNVETAGV